MEREYAGESGDCDPPACGDDRFRTLCRVKSGNGSGSPMPGLLARPCDMPEPGERVRTDGERCHVIAGHRQREMIRTLRCSYGKMEVALQELYSGGSVSTWCPGP